MVDSYTSHIFDMHSKGQYIFFKFTSSALSGADLSPRPISEGQLDKNSSMLENKTLSEKTARTDRFKAQEKPVRRPGKTFYNKPLENIFNFMSWSQNLVGCLSRQLSKCAYDAESVQKCCPRLCEY